MPDIDATTARTQAGHTSQWTQMAQGGRYGILGFLATLSGHDLIDHWLQQFGIAFDPFRYPASELDSHLDDYYVDPPNFESAFALTHSLLYAKSGAGKTAARLRIESHYANRFASDGVFAFSYTVPDFLAVAPPENLSGHIPHIIKSAVQSAFVLISWFGGAMPGFHAAEWARRFAWYLDRCYPTLQLWRDDLAQAVRDRSLHQALSSLDARFDESLPPALPGTVNSEWLIQWLNQLTPPSTPPKIARKVNTAEGFTLDHWSDLVNLLASAGVRSVMMLADGIDAKPGLIHPFEKMSRVARPLVQAMETAQLGADVNLKLFLPVEIEPLIARHLSTQHAVIRAKWDGASLRLLIGKRLSLASGGVIRSLNQLVDKEVNQNFSLEEHLIEQSGFLPRSLIHAIEKLFEQHALRFSKGEVGSRITFNSIEAFLEQYSSHVMRLQM